MRSARRVAAGVDRGERFFVVIAELHAVSEDRHHREELDGPTKTRERVVYDLFNDRKHHAQNGGAITDESLTELVDRSSAAWLDGWDPRAGPPPETIARLRARDGDIDGFGAPCTAPETWLAQEGWRIRTRRGAIKLHELPRFV